MIAVRIASTIKLYVRGVSQTSGSYGASRISGDSQASIYSMAIWASGVSRVSQASWASWASGASGASNTLYASEFSQKK